MGEEGAIAESAVAPVALTDAAPAIPPAAQTAPAAGEPLPAGPPHGYTMPDSLARDGLAHNALRIARAAGIPDDTVRDVLDWVAKGGGNGEFDALDAADEEAATEELRGLFGEEFGSNVSTLRSYLSRNLPSNVSDALLSARFPDGRRVANDPAVLVRLMGLAKRSPAMPEPTGDVERDIRAIEAAMRDNREAYNADVGLQARALELYAERQRRSQQ